MWYLLLKCAIFGGACYLEKSFYAIEMKLNTTSTALGEERIQGNW